MSEHRKQTPVSAAYSHLSEEERIDKACELLAMGVLRLAQKRGLLAAQQKESLEYPNEKEKLPEMKN